MRFIRLHQAHSFQLKLSDKDVPDLERLELQKTKLSALYLTATANQFCDQVSLKP
jgi:hypothetical protein